MISTTSDFTSSADHSSQQLLLSSSLLSVLIVQNIDNINND
jgi:hypothetical protein